jgi:hypothetical protein
MELRKAVVTFRKMLAEEPLSMLDSHDKKYGSKKADVRALLVLSSVCRYWSRIFSTCHRRSLQQLRRSFKCKLICLLFSFIKTEESS